MNSQTATNTGGSGAVKPSAKDNSLYIITSSNEKPRKGVETQRTSRNGAPDGVYRGESGSGKTVPAKSTGNAQSPYSAPAAQGSNSARAPGYDKKKPAQEEPIIQDDGSTGGSGEEAAQGIYRRAKKSGNNPRGGSTYRGAGPPSMQQQRMVYQAYKRQAVSTGRQGVTSQSPNAPGQRPGQNLQIENPQYQQNNQYTYNGQYTPQATTANNQAHQDLQTQRQGSYNRGGQTTKAAAQGAATGQNGQQVQFYQYQNYSPAKQPPAKAPAAAPAQGKGQVATQATKELLKKTLDFTPSQLQELSRAGRFGKEPVPQEYAIIPPQTPAMRGRKTLVLDLDETLIHSKFSLAQVQASRFQGRPDFQMRIIVDGRPIQVYVLIRPGVLFFLQKMALIYELVLYTASMNIYANPLVDTLDQEGLIGLRLYREHCFSFQGSYIKDLSLLGRPMKDTIIVDNSPNAYYFHPENAVPSISWYDDLDDRGLFELIPLLEALSQVDDVRSVIPNFVTPEAVVDLPKAATVLNEQLRRQSLAQKKPKAISSKRRNEDEVEDINDDATEDAKAKKKQRERALSADTNEAEEVSKQSSKKNREASAKPERSSKGQSKSNVLEVTDDMSDDDADKEALDVSQRKGSTSLNKEKRVLSPPKSGSNTSRPAQPPGTRILKSSELDPPSDLTQEQQQQQSQKRGGTSGNHKGQNLEILTPAETIAMQPPATTHLQRMMQVRSTTNKSKNDSQNGAPAANGTPLSPTNTSGKGQGSTSSRRQQEMALAQAKQTPTGNFQPRNQNLFQPGAEGNADKSQSSSVKEQRRRTGGGLGTTVMMGAGIDEAQAEPTGQRRSKQGMQKGDPAHQPNFKNNQQVKISSNANSVDQNNRRISRAQQLMNNQQQSSSQPPQANAQGTGVGTPKPLNFNMRRGIERYHQGAPGVISGGQQEIYQNPDSPPMVRGATGGGSAAPSSKLIGKNSLHMKRRSEHPDNSALAAQGNGQNQAHNQYQINSARPQQRYTADGNNYNGNRNNGTSPHGAIKQQHMFNPSGLSVGGVTPSNSAPSHQQIQHYAAGEAGNFQLPTKNGNGSSTTPIFQKRIQTFSASHLDKQSNQYGQPPNSSYVNKTPNTAGGTQQNPSPHHTGAKSQNTGNSVGLLQNVVMQQPQPPKTSRVMKVVSPQSARGGPAQLNLNNNTQGVGGTTGISATGAQSQSTRHRNPPMLISTPMAQGAPGASKNVTNYAMNQNQTPRQNQWANFNNVMNKNNQAQGQPENRSQKNFNATAPAQQHNHQIVFNRQDSQSRGKLKVTNQQSAGNQIQNPQTHARVLSVPRERPAPQGANALQGGQQFRIPPGENSKTKNQIPQQQHSRSQSHSHGAQPGIPPSNAAPVMFSQRGPPPGRQ